MLRNIFLSSITIIFIAAIAPVNAQVISKDYGSVAMQALVKSKVHVVLTNDTTYNKWLRTTITNVWTATEFSFVTTTELDSLVKSDKNVFLFPQSRDDRGATFHLLTADDLSKKKEYLFILSQGGFRQTKYLYTPATSGPKIIGFFRYSPERAEVTAGDMECEMLIAFMNQSLQIIIDNKMKGSARDSVWDHIYTEAPQIKDKTMLFNKAYSDGTIELDKKVLLNNKLIDDYPFPYQQAAGDTLRQLLQDDAGTYVYLFLYYPSAYVNQADDSGDILVYDPALKKMLYYDDNLYGPWFEKGEMKDMIYAIKEK